MKLYEVVTWRPLAKVGDELETTEFLAPDIFQVIDAIRRDRHEDMGEIISITLHQQS